MTVWATALYSNMGDTMHLILVPWQHLMVPGDANGSWWFKW